MPLIANIQIKNGDIKGIVPYSKENLDKYHQIWNDVFSQTIQQMREYRKEFDDFYSNLDSFDHISQAISTLKERFKEFLTNSLKYDDTQVTNIIYDCWKKFERQFIINLQSKLGNIELDENIKKVLGKYYINCVDTEEWDYTIGICCRRCSESNIHC